MAKKVFPQSQVPVRKSVDLLPEIFKTAANDKFLSGVLDPLIQPGVLEKTVGFIGRRYGKTYKGDSVYLDTDATLRSRYQLETGVIYNKGGQINNFFDYLDFKNQLKFFNNHSDRDDKLTSDEHYTWNPPLNWDKFANYREYFWEPVGPPSVPVFGQAQTVTSTYSVSLGMGSSFVFSPDGKTNNPTITLYRGQTYRFNVDAPNEGFAIKTNYDTGSLLFNPNFPYVTGQLAIFGGIIWKATKNLLADPSRIITEDSSDWELLSVVADNTALDFNTGVTNNRLESGVLEFTVPFDAPSVLFYQGLVDPNRVGKFFVESIESNTAIDVKQEIVGKQTYTSSNGIAFTNGLVVEFRGNVTPTIYEKDTWLVEGVGKQITLTRFRDLVVPALPAEQAPEVLFDNRGFDVEPFDDATAFPRNKDYITVERNSQDLNPWSRYNRWFHRSVLEFAYEVRGQSFPESESARAKRPIIEFTANLQLFNHGSVAKETVDFIDSFTDDVFSKIEGSTSYSVDGEFLFDGARVLIIADTDNLANNRIYQVKYITFKNNRQITLRPTADSESVVGEGVLVRRGNKNAGLMYHFTGSQWVKSQEKLSVNQAPLFDVYDENEISFADNEQYPVSSFIGSKIVSYRIGNSVADSELGFSLSYRNIDNVGDIVFDWNWDTEEFEFTVDRQQFKRAISTGFFKFNNDNNFQNGWTTLDNAFIQPIIDSVILEDETAEIEFRTINWNTTNQLKINFYLNGNLLTDSCKWFPFTRENNVFKFATQFEAKSAIVIKVVGDVEPNEGYYEIPAALEKNPLNIRLQTFTYGQAVEHLTSALEFDSTTRFCSVSLINVRNLRDLSGYQQRASRFLKHAGLAPLAISLLCDKDVNVVKSIQYAKKSYTEFKNNFLERAIQLELDDSIIDFVDTIILDLTKTKSTLSPFADSDMIGSGAYTAVNYRVEDEGIQTFALSDRFSLTALSRRAVYVYINNVQLLNLVDYEFNDTFGFVLIKQEIYAGDLIEIREYISTAVNYIPPTPTSLGLYKKFTPMKFVDDTYREPREVIQGHDGSITVAFGDFRDDLLLELEYRIYNNIKIEYDSRIFDIDAVVGSYYNNGLYNKSQLDSIVSQEFLKWIQNTNINYAQNEYFKETETFTYTYSNMSDPTRTQRLPGYWRGVYQWFYDTDRPHRCPWEMLGFSQQPDWWESEYGPAPYTNNNLILWEDLRDGVIRQGSKAGTHSRYARPTLLQHLPVDNNGKLLSPLESNLAQNFVLLNAKSEFKIGDVAPVEHAWRTSSEWAFAVTLAMTLMKPFEFISDSINRSKVKINKVGQQVNEDTNYFLKLEDFRILGENTTQSAGLFLYLIDYVKSKGNPVAVLEEKISSIDVRLTSRLSGFVDKDQQKYLLDSKNPASMSSSIFVPTENYDIFFNVSCPIATVSYSGVIVEKTESGWIINGYDTFEPFFNYFEAVPNQRDPVIAVGGVSENFVDWAAGRTFSNGQIVKFRNEFYRSIRTHLSVTEFDTTQWRKLPKIPVVGGITAQRRRNFNRFKSVKLSYGSLLRSVQEVVDFLLGYENYLMSRGFVFDNYDFQNQTSQDWTTSAKEFMFWTRHNWTVGSLITLSPAAEKIKVTIPTGVASSLLDGFYDYQILKADGKPLLPQFINVNRDFQEITITTADTTEGLYYAKLYYVLKEHVVIFDDKTVFNDVLYDETTGYRQERIKSRGFRTTDWDGDYTSPGFLFDNINVGSWEPFVDYKLGDIVSYKTFFWTSQQNQIGAETFNELLWVRTEVNSEKKLIANFDYKINQIEDYFNVDSEGIGDVQREQARHTIGYQTRDYLQDLAEDPTTQFQLYQGFIRDKGTQNAIVKVFDKLSRSGDSSVILNEEWAFKVGQLGGVDQIVETEVELFKNNFELNPQPLLFVESSTGELTTDRYYRIPRADFTIVSAQDDLNINPTSLDSRLLRTPGYVSTNQVDFILKTKDNILDVNIEEVVENDHFWITFDNHTWNVLRYNSNTFLIVTGVEKVNDSVTITFNRPHFYKADDVIGIIGVENLTGFYKILTVTGKSVTVFHNQDDPIFEQTISVVVGSFTPSRYKKFDTVDLVDAARLPQGAKLWIDHDEAGYWKVVEKTNQFKLNSLTAVGVLNPSLAGSAVVHSAQLNQTIASVPGSGIVVAYVESAAGLEPKQVLAVPVGFESQIQGTFGVGLSISDDGRWLVAGTPGASGVKSNYVGAYNPQALYFVNDVVLFLGQLWKAKRDIVNDGSTIDLGTQDWEPATNIPAVTTGRSDGFTNQGMITIYENVQQRWQLRQSFVSPRPAQDEFFGSKISISQKESEYYIAVSAVGSSNNKGRVYLYAYKNNQWQHDVDRRYSGIYQASTVYPKGSVVWYDSRLWEAQVNVPGDQSTIGIDQEISSEWKQLDEIASHSSLPQPIAIASDASIIDIGLLGELQTAELIKQGDRFGSSIAMSATGDILIVGAPESDGQFFENYKGIWTAYQQYAFVDVVKFQGIYYKLIVDSALNEQPDDSPLTWEIIGSTDAPSIGKVFVYVKSLNGGYRLKQTITAGTLVNSHNLEFPDQLALGDQLGFSLDISKNAETLVIAAPRVDVNLQDQGAAYIFVTDDLSNVEYSFKQKLESYEFYPNEYFGQSISLSGNAEKIVVGARNTPFVTFTSFDDQTTGFDRNRTKFVDQKGFAGAVYVYENKAGRYFLTEKLQADLSPFESFGFSVDCSGDVVVVGSPNYIVPARPALGSPTFVYTGPQVGNVRLFRKSPNVSSWTALAKQLPLVDIEKVKSIALYDNIRNVKIADIDYIDHPKLKILNIADQEIKFKTLYDPAVYNVGTEEQVVDARLAWAERHVGELWWNVSTAKWLYHEQGDDAYRFKNANRLLPESSIDVYEWVESQLLPSDWSALADTNEGISLGISGQPLHPNNDVLTSKELLNSLSGLPTETVYYYWVRNKVVVPQGVTSRRISAAEVAALIRSPETSGIPYISIIGKTQLLAYNFELSFASETALLNIQYKKQKGTLNPVHSEYQLLTEGVASSIPAGKLEEKWIDSLIGFNVRGNRVPDSSLPAKQQYGILFRPRQSMFVERLPILKTTIEKTNNILRLEPFADLIDFSTLESFETPPAAVLNLYDFAIPLKIDLENVGTVRVRAAVLQANIVDGELDTIDILDTGFGYRTVPPVEIIGNGQGAKATVTLDRDGRISTVTVVARGKKYSTVTAKVRQFSVLVEADETANGFWSIYSWDDRTKEFLRSKTQGFDTRRYWSLVDWWKPGYAPESRIVREIELITDEPKFSTSVGDLIRIKEFAQGGWAVFEKVSTVGLDFLENYRLIARQQGTVEFSQALYNRQVSGIGYDFITSFDTGFYDLGIAVELRNIFKAIKEDIFVGEYAVQWNILFFSGIRYAFAEQQYIDWAFKTSFLDATHNIGEFEKKTNYQSDRLESFRTYIEEVKPYRTTVREYVSRYTSLDQTGTVLSDFDLPSRFSKNENKIVPVTANDSVLEQYPWRAWNENQGFSITEIRVSDRGENYTQIPQVIIEGNGTGAAATAFISNGNVIKVKVTNPGIGYTKAPVVALVGGNVPGSRIAKAVAILGDSKIRTFDLTVKFDRIHKEGTYKDLNYVDTIIATGFTAAFDLTYPPNKQANINVVIDQQLIISSDYAIKVTNTVEPGYTVLKGRIIFDAVPQKGAVIEIRYEKDDSLLDSINRIEKYYNPRSGMRSKDINQLMTGIDFGGVQIQGTTFDVTGGWDALPWFTDSWDSVEASPDYYVVSDGSTTDVTLPFVPTDGEVVNIYLKRVGEDKETRIDELNFESSTGSSNLDAAIPTFIGDGVTSVITVGTYLQLDSGDTLIFRLIDSDGSVSIRDPNLLDTELSGGTLNRFAGGAYATATGLTPEEIIIEGEKFISPDQVPAPEENIPGQVLESLSIKVFSSTLTGALPLETSTVISDGITLEYSIGITVVESKSIIVYVDKNKQVIEQDYSVNFRNNQVIFSVAPPTGSVIEIISFGIGGVSILDYQDFVADGNTTLFLTNANYNDTNLVFVTVNGVQINTEFIDSTGIADTTGKTLIQFGIAPSNGEVVRIISIGVRNVLAQQPIIRVNQQIETFDGSTRSLPLTNFVNFESVSTLSSMLVEVNNVALQGVDTVYEIYNGDNNQFVLGTDPLELAGVILTPNIEVYVNGQLRTFILDYVYDGVSKIVTIESSILRKGDIVEIINSFRSNYSVSGNNLIINSGVLLNEGDKITITWFDRYDRMRIISDEYTGGKVNYRLFATPLNSSYVWVYKNGIRLTQDFDFSVSLPRGVVFLSVESTLSDTIKIVVFSSAIYKDPSAFEIYKDMLNFYHFKRFELGPIKLTKALTYYDQTIEVNNASLLSAPDKFRNIPGIVFINGEKIEYLGKEGNTLTQLRRGSRGTPIAEMYSVDTDVVDLGPQATIPYQDTQGVEKFDSLQTATVFYDGSTSSYTISDLLFVGNGNKQDIFVKINGSLISDADYTLELQEQDVILIFDNSVNIKEDDEIVFSSLFVGPLEHIPVKAQRPSWYIESIPDEYGACDQVEVFVAGRRLRKDPISVYSEDLGSFSPAADKQIESEFSVDGFSKYVRLTEVPLPNTEVSVVRRIGKSWYDRGEFTANSGITLLDNTSAIAKFIAQKTTKLPE